MAITVLYALVGLLVGAAINLCADQLPLWRKIRRTPFCPFCDAPRPAWAWISTLAFLRLKPACPHCGAPIPWRHPLVELGTAALFGFLWYWYGMAGDFAFLIPYTVYSAIFVLVLVIDLEHKLILNIVIYPAWILALLGSLFHPQPHFYRLALLGGAVGFGVLYLIYLLGELFVKVMSRIRGKQIHAVAFGFGDVRLGGFIGLVLGFPDVLAALLVAILLGGLGGILYWFVSAVLLRRYSLFTAIPYGPFLVLGAMYIMFFR
ncbi:MAG: prepilin peptidase [Anaerolineae bacterium]|jgi:leader peptidase (prepilin peptidase)/N-methyltransferase